MFAAALKLAQKFTFPVISLVALRDGKRGASIGAFVLVNADGWALTAAHIARDIKRFADQAKTSRQYDEAASAIEANGAIDHREKRRQLKGLVRPGQDTALGTSTLWGMKGVRAVDARLLPSVDLALVRLEGVDPARHSTFPKFKDPVTDLDPGTSVCRLGFPFHEIKPDFDASARRFTLPQDALPIPFFPIDGIVTRFVERGAPAADPPELMFETSSPGLMGQSGGPIFDTKGVVWGIQSSTNHLALGYDPKGPDGKSLRLPQQFLHVGWGVHPVTVVGFMKKQGINFQLA